MNSDNIQGIDFVHLKMNEKMNLNQRMSNKNNNMMQNNSMNSSDIGEIEEEEEKNKKTIQPQTFNYLKNHLSITNKRKNNEKYNLEFPIEFSKSNDSSPYLGSYISISNPPTLYFDLSNKQLYEHEIELNELAKIIAAKNETIKFYEKQLQEAEKTLKDYTIKLKEKENNLTYYKSLEIESENKIKELREKKNELFKSFPGKNQEDKSNKNISLKEYRELKFQPPKPDETLITKTLQKDLLDYSQFIQAEINKKKMFVMKVISNIQAAVNELTEDFEVQVYGSYATGLCLPWSDLDLVLVNRNINNIHLPPPFSLKNVCEVLATKPWVYSIKLIDHGSIHIVKINTKEDFKNLQIDISIQTEKHYGLKCVELVNSYLNEYKVIKPLILALKTILKNANLNNPYKGGLSSYGVILMVVSYIQNKINTETYKEEEDLIGKTFYGFLGHYGIFFDYNNYLIITYPINDKEKGLNDSTPTLPFGPSMHELIIVDPLNKQNNVAKSTHQFMNLKMAFMIAFMVTKEECECGCHYGKAFLEYSMTSTEHCILKRMFNSVKRFSDPK